MIIVLLFEWATWFAQFLCNFLLLSPSRRVHISFSPISFFHAIWFAFLLHPLQMVNCNYLYDYGFVAAVYVWTTVHDVKCSPSVKCDQTEITSLCKIMCSEWTVDYTQHGEPWCICNSSSYCVNECDLRVCVCLYVFSS